MIGLLLDETTFLGREAHSENRTSLSEIVGVLERKRKRLERKKKKKIEGSCKSPGDGKTTIVGGISAKLFGSTVRPVARLQKWSAAPRGSQTDPGEPQKGLLKISSNSDQSRQIPIRFPFAKGE